MRKRLVIPLILVVALGLWGGVRSATAAPDPCPGEICKPEGGCRTLANACCVHDPCETCVCF